MNFLARWLVGSAGPYVLAILLAALIGTAGWALYLRADAISQAHRADTLFGELRDATNELRAQRAAIDAAVSEAKRRQSETLALLHAQQRLQESLEQFKSEVSHVHFNPPSRPAVAGVCPSHPVDSVEFERLYNRASVGARRDPDAGASGVPAVETSSDPR